ncbi:NAD-dependent epimerase/dehydratase family protein [Pelagicoccus sp. SDUM812002]|uniref:NAD-dependent epimerase/dehydratase family protein n=1 Tax=Pelagicoccus sp. SDUM812002 TaxID=3041266 RepID=UPI00280E9D0D|nr:NAD-dependent epimerase/dehydratase family protein [Pelagicoccus sp. SDUM812002]MDQ8185374.1 NAD-dependent epimerase/dehydratase family protein [Pelagicoccus sp. SDUM812002]
MNTPDKQNILVLGGSGTVGSAVVEAFSAAGDFEVHAVSRQGQSEIPGVVSHCFDLHASSIVSNLPAIEFDYIVDCAQPRYHAEDAADFGIDHIRKIEAACSARTKKLIYTSGVWVYGDQARPNRISEQSPLAPLEFAKARMPILEYLQESSYPWIQLCLPSIVYGSVGPFQEMVRKARESDLVSIYDEAVLWSVVERCDLAQAYLSVINERLNQPVYCIAEPDTVSVVAFFDAIGQAVKKPIPRKTREALSESLSKGDHEVTFASQPVDSELIRRQAGWKPKHRYSKDFWKFVNNGDLEEET